MKKDIQVILEISKRLGVILHETYNEELYNDLIGNLHTENIIFSELVLYAVSSREKKHSIFSEDFWDVVQYLKPMAQLFAQVNDISVIEWNGYVGDVVEEYIEYKIDTKTLDIN